MKQLSLKFSPKESYLSDDYVVGNCNRDAYSIIMKSNGPWGVLPFPHHLLLVGPKFSGKTFLAQLWAKKHGVDFSVGDSLEGSVIDDIDLLNEKKLLFHFNKMHEEGKQLLMTTTSKPNFELSDLQSRINSVRAIQLNMPDQEMLSVLLLRYFSSRSLKVAESTIKYLEKHLERDFESIKLFIDRLDDYALDNGRNITIPLINNLLKF